MKSNLTGNSGRETTAQDFVGCSMVGTLGVAMGYGGYGAGLCSRRHGGTGRYGSSQYLIIRHHSPTSSFWTPYPCPMHFSATIKKYWNHNTWSNYHKQQVLKFLERTNLSYWIVELGSIIDKIILMLLFLVLPASFLDTERFTKDCCKQWMFPSNKLCWHILLPSPGAVWFLEWDTKKVHIGNGRVLMFNAHGNVQM